MSKLDALYVFLGTVQAIATVWALLYAWRAVHEGRLAERQRDRERVATRLGNLADIVNELDKWTRNANGLLARQEQARLRIALVGVDLPLPKTRVAARATGVETLDVQASFQPVARAALDELIAEGEALAARSEVEG